MLGTTVAPDVADMSRRIALVMFALACTFGGLDKIGAIAVASAQESAAHDAITTPPVGTQPTDPRNAHAMTEHVTRASESHTLFVVIMVIFAIGVAIAVTSVGLGLRARSRARDRRGARDRAA
jgi:hypothetical protein